MEQTKISKTMLVADLSICCIWLMCVVHNVANGRSWCRPVIWAIPLLRMWLSFLIYRRSRMALAPIVMLSLLTIGALSGRALSGFALFVEPLLLLLRAVPMLLGDPVITSDNLQDIWSGMNDKTVPIGLAISLWLIFMPLCIYVYRLVRKMNVPSQSDPWKRAGLYAYLTGAIIVESHVVASFQYCFVSVFVLCLQLMLIPVIFYRGRIEGLITKGEMAFILILILLGVAYTCAINYSTASVITAASVPMLFYSLVCWTMGKEVGYLDAVLIISASFLFALGQYTIGMYRVILLMLSLGLMAAALIRFGCATGRPLTASLTYVMIAIVLPVFCIGYNPYSVQEARKIRLYDGYEYSRNGLMLVIGRDGVGIRDRYELILPPEYEEVEHLMPAKPYCKVKKDGKWMIYDLIRQKLLSEELFSDVLPYTEYTYILKSDEKDKYLVLPKWYSRYNEERVAVITESMPEEE